MPAYLTRCTNPACELNGEPQEFFCRATQRDGLRCACGQPLDTHPGQFAGVAVQRCWTHSKTRGVSEARSQAMVFQEAGIPEIKRDCPSMDFEVRNGEATPIFHNDAHHRACMGQMKKARDRYEGERKAERQAKRGRVNKTKVIRELKEKAGIST